MARAALLGLALAATPLAAQRPAPAATVAAAPPANVRAGVDLWRAGDYPGAVAIWQPFANAGDPDAMFNIGQAYKLGRALPLDKVIARDWYRRAAAKGHLPAQANLGILLFQAGEKPEAARWLKMAADRGEMRAQYVLGVAHWNGDGVARSLALAYAYLTRASAQGLTEATGALGNLNQTISPAERSNGQTITASLAVGNGVPTTYATSAAPTNTAQLNRMTMEAVQKPAPMPAVPVVPVPKPVVAKPVPAPVVERPAAVAPPLPKPVPKPVVVASAPAPAAPVPTPAPAAPAPTPVPAARPVVPTSVVTVPVAAPPIAVRPAPPAVRTTELPPAAPPVVQAAAPKPVLPKPIPVAMKPVEKALPAEKSKVADKPKVADKAQVADKSKVADKAKPVETPPGWRVQLGAFGKKAQAEAAWDDVVAKQKTAVGKAKPIYEP
ncbi:MAG: sel1 repeat family protein, partial [Sandarakinorhabdus sp.]|nr:sel1 repeat family protein [Sandarakinorhabdus sp.]